MQHSDDRPPASGRPSLLSAEQQGEADRQRILSGLETKPSLTTAGASKARSGAIKWAAAGAAVLALTAGAGAWLVSEGEKEIVLAGTAPLPATPAPAVPLASEPAAATTAPAGEEISAAAILQDTPVIAEKPTAATAPERPAEELKSLLEKGLPAPKRAAAPPLVLADAPPFAAKPAAPAAKPARPPSAKPAPKPKTTSPKPAVAEEEASEARASNVQPRVAAKTTTAKTTRKTAAKTDPKTKTKTAAKSKDVPPKASTKVEDDVDLLAALVAHSKATEPKRVNTNAAKLKECKTLGSAADAEQCRAKLCAGPARHEAECKARAAKPAGEG